MARKRVQGGFLYTRLPIALHFLIVGFVPNFILRAKVLNLSRGCQDILGCGLSSTALKCCIVLQLTMSVVEFG